MATPGFSKNRRRMASFCAPWLPTANPARNSPTTINGSQTSAADSTVSTTEASPRQRSVYRLVSSASLMPRRPHEADSDQLPWSTPHRLVDRVLCRQGAVEGGILSPASRNVAKIALTAAAFPQASPAGQGLNRHFVQAFALLLRGRA